MEPIEAFTTAWRRSFNYGGRATRAEYWWFCLLAYLIQFFLPFLLAFVPAIGTGPVFIYGFAQIFPTISITVRRLRDIGKDWKWILISFVPFIGIFWLIYLLCQPSGRYEKDVQPIV